MESKTSETIEAEWLGIGQGGNRATAPDVYKGERVLLFRFADEDKYFWDKVYNERILRRLERVLYLYSGHMLPPTVENDTKNSYWVLMSTLDKVVHFHTSISNGEKFEWDFKLDTDKGQFTLSDNSGILHTYDAPTSSVTFDVVNRQHFISKDIILQASRRLITMGGSGGSFFGPKASSSVNDSSLSPNEHVNPVTTGDRRPASRMMAAGQGAYKYEGRTDDYDYSGNDTSVERYDVHDFPNDTESSNDRYSIWDAIGIQHNYDSPTSSTSFYVRQKAYYRSNNTEFDVRVRYLVNAPIIDLGSETMNIDTKELTVTTNNILEYHNTKNVTVKDDYVTVVTDGDYKVTSKKIELDGDTYITKNLHVDEDVFIEGDLTVQGNINGINSDDFNKLLSFLKTLP